MRVIYLSGCVPYNGITGGRLACYNHLIKLSKEYDEVLALFIDLDGDANSLVLEYPKNINFKIFERSISSNKTIKNIFLTLFKTIFSTYSRSMQVVYSRELIDFLKSELLNDDIIIIDQMDCYSNIAKLKNKKYVYISHNVESNMLYDKIFAESKKMFLYNYVNYIKTSIYEKIIIRKSYKTYFISKKDSFLFEYLKKDIYIIPEYIPVKNNQWDFKKSVNTILFVGSASHYPNKEAVLWIIQKFAPLLSEKDLNINIEICGMSLDQFDSYYIPENVIFLGRVSDQELEFKFLTSRIFISPIVLGSGIKMKVLEAASYGIPILSTLESINGIDFLEKNLNIFSRADEDFVIKFLSNYFNDSDFLKLQSKNIISSLIDIEKSNQKYIFRE